MESVVILVMVGLVAMAVAFVATLVRPDIVEVFGWVCWVPLAGFLLVLLFGKRFPAAAFGPAILIVLASACLTGFGVVFTLATWRRGGRVRNPLAATVVAALPLLMLALLGVESH